MEKASVGPSGRDISKWNREGKEKGDEGRGEKTDRLLQWLVWPSVERRKKKPLLILCPCFLPYLSASSPLSPTSSSSPPRSICCLLLMSSLVSYFVLSVILALSSLPPSDGEVNQSVKKWVDALWKELGTNFWGDLTLFFPKLKRLWWGLSGRCWRNPWEGW